MSDYDKIYDEHLDTELSDSSFVYKHPISGELHEGIGDPPLMWGDYPQGIVENTEEAYNYDIFRSNYIPLPHEVYSKENIGKIKATREGSQLNDPNWMVASKIVHSYLNRPRKINVRGNVRTVDTEPLKTGTDYAKWGVNFMSAFDYNMAALAIDAAKLNNAPENVLKSMYYLMETSDRDGVLLSNFGKGLYNVATDPFNLVGLGTLGIGVAGKYAGQKLTRMSLKELLKNAVIGKPTKVSAVVGAEGALYATVDNLARQNIKIDAKQQENINAGELATAVGAGAVIGERLGNALPNAIEGVRRGIVDLGNRSDNYLQNQDTGTTLTTGVDPTIPIAKGLSAAGKALKKQVIDIDEYNFYSKALEEAINLKQEKGTSQQFKSMLLKAGVKEDEMLWTGLNDLFASNPKITKDEIINHLKDNRIEIQEKVLAKRDMDEVEEDLDFTEVETDRFIVQEEVSYIAERIRDDITEPENNYSDNLVKYILNKYNFGFRKIDGTIEYADGYQSYIKALNPQDANQLNLQGIEPQKEVIWLELMDELLTEKLEKDGTFDNMQNFLDNESENPLAKRIVLDENEQEDKLSFLIDDFLVEQAESEYNDYGTLFTYRAETSDGTVYEILGNDDTGYTLRKDGAVLGDTEFSLDEVKITAHTDAMDYGHIRFPDDEYEEELLVDENNVRYLISGPPQYANADWQEPGGQNYREILFTNDNFKNIAGQEETVTHSHYTGFNGILAHVRVKDRVTPDGKKVLYLEEMQSDWAAYKRKHGSWGVRSKEEVEAVQKTSSKLSKILRDKLVKLQPSLKNAFIDSNVTSKEVVGSAAYQTALERIDKFLTMPIAFEPKDIQVRYNPLKQANAFDSAEEKAKDIDYGTLARMIISTKGDFDKVKYPEIEKELNEAIKLLDTLRENINSISTQKTPEGPFVSDVNKWGGLIMKRLIRMAKDQGYDHIAWSPGEVQIPRYSLSRSFKELEVTKNTDDGNELNTYFINATALNGYQTEYKFKEHKLADAVGPKLAAEIINNVKTGEYTSYKGDKLEITNPGMVGFYNKALPSITNDVLKKFDKNTKVKRISVEIGKFGNYEDRLGFDITDKMKTKVDQGIPLFTPAATTVGAGVTAKQMQNNEGDDGNT